MSELIKPKKENQFWDTSCIMHNKENLSEVIGNWGLATTLDDYEGDLNNISRTSYCVTNSKTLNAPTKACYYVFTFVKNPTYYILQIAVARDEPSIKVFMRIKSGVNWYSWVEK